MLDIFGHRHSGVSLQQKQVWPIKLKGMAAVHVGFSVSGPCYCACWLMVMVSRDTSMEWGHHYLCYSNYNKSKCLLYEKVYCIYSLQTPVPFILHRERNLDWREQLSSHTTPPRTLTFIQSPFWTCQNLPVWANTKEFLSNEESVADVAFFNI